MQAHTQACNYATLQRWKQSSIDATLNLWPFNNKDPGTQQGSTLSCTSSILLPLFRFLRTLLNLSEKLLHGLYVLCLVQNPVWELTNATLFNKVQIKPSQLNFAHKLFCHFLLTVQILLYHLVNVFAETQIQQHKRTQLCYECSTLTSQEFE